MIDYLYQTYHRIIIIIFVVVARDHLAGHNQLTENDCIESWSRIIAAKISSRSHYCFHAIIRRLGGWLKGCGRASAAATG